MPLATTNAHPSRTEPVRHGCQVPGCMTRAFGRAEVPDLGPDGEVTHRMRTTYLCLDHLTGVRAAINEVTG